VHTKLISLLLVTDGQLLLHVVRTSVLLTSVTRDNRLVYYTITHQAVVSFHCWWLCSVSLIWMHYKQCCTYSRYINTT